MATVNTIQKYEHEKVAVFDNKDPHQSLKYALKKERDNKDTAEDHDSKQLSMLKDNLFSEITHIES